jgi:hypothetical protein
MKKATISFALVILTLAAFSQTAVKQTENSSPTTTVGTVRFGADLLAELKYTFNNGDSLYAFTYMDQNYKQVASYKTIRFSSREMTADMLYTSFKAAFLPQNAPKRQVATFATELTIGDTEVLLSNLKGLRDMQLIFSTREGNVVSLTEKQVDKLFGRQ